MCILCCNRLKIIMLMVSLTISYIVIHRNSGSYFDQNLEALSDPEISVGHLCMVCNDFICVYTYPFPPYQETVNGRSE